MTRSAQSTLVFVSWLVVFWWDIVLTFCLRFFWLMVYWELMRDLARSSLYFGDHFGLQLLMVLDDSRFGDIKKERRQSCCSQKKTEKSFTVLARTRTPFETLRVFTAPLTSRAYFRADVAILYSKGTYWL